MPTHMLTVNSTTASSSNQSRIPVVSILPPGPSPSTLATSKSDLLFGRCDPELETWSRSRCQKRTRSRALALDDDERRGWLGGCSSRRRLRHVSRQAPRAGPRCRRRWNDLGMATFSSRWGTATAERVLSAGKVGRGRRARQEHRRAAARAALRSRARGCAASACLSDRGQPSSTRSTGSGEWARVAAAAYGLSMAGEASAVDGTSRGPSGPPWKT